MKLKINLVFYTCFLMYAYTYGQIHAYDYKRELKGITDVWHSVVLPNEIFKNVSLNLSDIRIYGITKDSDTIEAPYILKQNKGRKFDKNIAFQYVNKSTTNQGSFITFKIPLDTIINQIQLSFKEDNFDRLITVEGSQNLKDWYTVVDAYRIVSVKNQLMNYTFTTVNLPDSKYRYVRVFVKGENAPEVEKAQIKKQEAQEAKYKIHAVKLLKTVQHKQNKSTVITVDLDTNVPISSIKIAAKNTYDYYRSVQIEYLTDSIETDKGWRYRYQHLTSGVLNSIEKNEFKFYSTITNKIRIIVDNQDNEPLTIGDIEIKGYTHELITRFTTPATYYLTYGNNNVTKPSYDLQYITSKVPENLKKVHLGIEEIIEKKEDKTVAPLFENKLWLWGIMGIVIVLLGGFTFMMMKKK